MEPSRTAAPPGTRRQAEPVPSRRRGRAAPAPTGPTAADRLRRIGELTLWVLIIIPISLALSGVVLALIGYFLLK
jgi:hypothetical protein